MGVQTAGGSTSGHRAGGVAVLKGTAQPAADQPRRPPRADRLPVAFEPHLTGGITGQVAAIGVGQQRPQMQSSDLVLTSRCTTTVVRCPCGRAATSASQPASTRRRNAAPVFGSGGRCPDSSAPLS